ncbi:UxaA family hydrolase [Thermohalobacter berrensis]|uniref:D-galactarate dehydratase n=1 Tax=Thermohalobacter berrensis TaxID=99594 RepID=A0A419T1C1_9FIRM|nr:UxaA family hydrolase [Thermohalobacter berrensis]RKD31267.1 D-galactarate dehydratase [Thermohalobacter berrensis]
MKFKAVIANFKDNVATAISNIKKGETVSVKIDKELLEITSNENIPFGHKLSLTDIPKGEDVIKYGEVIGRATRNIRKGDYVHIHNVESKRGRGDLVR